MTCVQIPDDLLDTLQAELEGTCTTLTALIEQHGLDVAEDTLGDRLLDGSGAVELCIDCGWWHRVCELEFDEARNGGVCTQCMNEE